MRYLVALSALLLAGLLIACTGEAENGPPQIVGVGANTSGDSPQAANIVEINMTARNWEFEPSTIRVRQGDLVRINVTSMDVAHGVGIEGYTEQVKFGANESAVLEFVADKPGTFRFYCNVFCGEGHRNMSGQLIVE